MTASAATSSVAVFRLVRGDEGLEFADRFRKDFDVGFEFLLDAGNQQFQPLDERVVSSALAPVQRYAGDAVEEAAGRMLPVAEKPGRAWRPEHGIVTVRPAI